MMRANTSVVILVISSMSITIIQYIQGMNCYVITIPQTAKLPGEFNIRRLMFCSTPQLKIAHGHIIAVITNFIEIYNICNCI